MTIATARKATLVSLILLFYSGISVSGEVLQGTGGIELTGGVSAAIYQSVYSLQQSFALEMGLRGELGHAFGWQAGVRLGLGPALPEIYGRVLVTQQIGSWQPDAGLEFGYTRRGRFEAGKELLREMRQATETDISPFYAAVHAAPLSFRLGDRWRVSFIEIQFGTHIGHPGRTLRAHVGLLSVGVTL